MVFIHSGLPPYFCKLFFIISESKTVLLLRAVTDSPSKVDNYAKLASKQKSIQLVNLPVLTFEFINSDSLLRELNNNHDNYNNHGNKNSHNNNSNNKNKSNHNNNKQTCTCLTKSYTALQG